MYGQMQSSMMQLPADCNSLTTRFWYPNAPAGVPPISFQFNSAPELSGQSPVIAAALITEIQNAARNNNPARIFSCNYLSTNGYQNPEFYQLMNYSAEFLQYLILKFGNNSPDQLLGTMANKMAAFMTAMYVLNQFPVLANNLSQQAHNQMVSLLQEIDNCKRELVSLRNQAIQMMQPASYSNGPIYNRSPSGAGIAMQSGMGLLTGNSLAYTGNRTDPSLPEPIMGNIVAARETCAPQAETTNTTIGRQMTELTMESSGVSARYAPETQFKSDATSGPSKSSSGRCISLNGNEECLASLSLEKRTFDIKKSPYPVAYNPTKHILFHNKDVHGIVREVLKPIAEVTVDYTQHELDPLFRSKATVEESSRKGKVVPVWDCVQSVTQSKDIVVDDSIRDIEMKAHISSSLRVMTTSFEEALITSKLRLAADGIKVAKDHVFEFSARFINPFYLTEKEANLLVNIKHDAPNINDFEETVQFMRSLAGMIDSTLWHFLNDRLTKLVNETMLYGMGINTSIDSFTDDIFDLQDIISRRNSIETVNTFLAKKEKIIIRSAFKFLKEGELLDNYLNGRFYDDYNDFKKEQFIVFYEDHFVTKVPWASSDIELKMMENYGMVMESYMPEFYRALKSMIDRARRENIYNVCLMTTDNVKIRVHESIICNDAVIVSI